DVAAAITELGVGEALVSFLDANGTPGIVERALIVPPRSRVGPITAEQRLSIVNWSPFQGKYDRVVDRESAYEILQAKAERAAQPWAAARAVDREAKEQGRLAKQATASTKREPRKTAASPAIASKPAPSTVVAVPAPGIAPTVAPQAERRGFMRGIL